MSIIRYFVNKEKRTVACVMYQAESDANNGIRKYLASNGDFDYGWDMFSKMQLPSAITGIAKCSPDDEWNEEFGKQLARERCYNKYEALKLEKYRKIMTVLTSMVDDIDNHLILPIETKKYNK